MRRRQFLGAFGYAAAWPLAARAQQPKKPRRIAFVHSAFPADRLTETAGAPWVRRFFETLRLLGDAEGGNLVVERYSAEGRSDRYAALAAEVVSRNPDVIVANQNDLIKAFTVATATLPIVALASDPIAAGLVTNLARPGSNLTGVSIDAGIEIFGKRLQLLKEAMPSAAKVAYLEGGRRGPDDPRRLADREAAQRLNIALTLNFLPEVNDAQIRRIFGEMAEQQMDAAVLGEGGNYFANRALIIELAEKYRIPTIYPFRDYADSGGLMAYAPDLGELAQRMANSVHEILNGAKAGDIPFYQPAKFGLVINLKTAKALGLNVPPSLLARADEVIE